MSTFLEMQSRIADELDDDDIQTGGQIALAILSAIQDYRDKRFWFNQIKAKSFTLTSGTEYLEPTVVVTNIATSEPFVVIDLLRIDDGSAANYRDMVLVDDATIDAWQTGDITGRPSHFSLVADSTGTRIRFYPIPDQTYTPILTALIRFADLDADGDTNPWTTDGEVLIRQAAKRHIKIDVTKELPYDAPPGASERMALDALQKSTRLRRGATNIGTEVAGMQGSRLGAIADIRFG